MRTHVVIVIVVVVVVVVVVVADDDDDVTKVLSCAPCWLLAHMIAI